MEHGTRQGDGPANWEALVLLGKESRMKERGPGKTKTPTDARRRTAARTGEEEPTATEVGGSKGDRSCADGTRESEGPIGARKPGNGGIRTRRSKGDPVLIGATGEKQ